jgi:transposase
MAPTQKSERTKAYEALVSDRLSEGARRGSARKKRKTIKPMNDFKQFTAFAGLDWASDHHDMSLVDREGAIIDQWRFEHNAVGWEGALQRLRNHGQVAVAVETNQGLAVQQLLDAGLAVYPVSPKAAARYRGRKAPSGAKDDQLDAWSLADALRVDGHGWRVLEAQDPLVSELRLLCADEIALIEQRTALINQLQAALKEYYPAALEAFDDWAAESSWHFVVSFPTPQALAKGGKRKWEKFLHTHRLWRKETAEKRLEIFASQKQISAAAPVVAARSLLAQSVAKVLVTLEAQLRSYRSRIEELFARHPDHDLFGSLPGAGPKMAPRLLSFVSKHTAQCEDVNALQMLAGTAPVSFKSGEIHRVYVRHHCDKRLRHTVHLWADLSRARCSWADAYYKAHRERGQSHACALRCLGQRWLKILFKMIETKTPYNEALHTRNQIKHGSWVLALNKA